jgi:hypothetical protein
MSYIIVIFFIFLYDSKFSMQCGLVMSQTKNIINNVRQKNIVVLFYTKAISLKQGILKTK